MTASPADHAVPPVGAADPSDDETVALPAVEAASHAVPAAAPAGAPPAARPAAAAPVQAAPAGPAVVAETVDLVKVHGTGASAVMALGGVSLRVPAGTLTAIVGPSGSGKSVLLHCLAGLDTPTSGRVLVGGTDMAALSDAARSKLRRERIGLLFPVFSLLPKTTVGKNIDMQLTIARRKPDPEWRAGLVELLELGDLLRLRPDKLTGEQQQRVALARALVGRPALVLADEPTAHLQTAAAHRFLVLLLRAVRELGQTVLLATNDPVTAAYAEQVLVLRDGRPAGALAFPTPQSVLAATLAPAPVPA